jgi:hypothetical protein
MTPLLAIEHLIDSHADRGDVDPDKIARARAALIDLRAAIEALDRPSLTIAAVPLDDGGVLYLQARS